MRTAWTTFVLLALAFAPAQASQQAPQEPYTFDYFVYTETEGGTKPVVIFGTGKTTYIQLPAGVQARSVFVRKGGREKPSDIYLSDPYIVVREPHDSIRVVTDKGAFVAERTGKKTEVELAEERAGSMAEKLRAAQARIEEQNREIEKLKGALKETKEAPGRKEGFAKADAQGAGRLEIVEVSSRKAEPEPQMGRQEERQERLIVSIPAGAALSSAVAEFVSAHDFALTWQARERYPTLNLRFEGRFESVIDEIARTFGLTAYMVGKTLVFVDAK